jgi:acetyl-CoA acetyltransferase
MGKNFSIKLTMTFEEFKQEFDETIGKMSPEELHQALIDAGLDAEDLQNDRLDENIRTREARDDREDC